MPTASKPAAITPDRYPLHAVRCAIGGMFMGLANLVPGISGGTMLLATGVYPAFITSIADATRLRFKTPTVLTLGVIVAAAALAIVAFAGPIKTLVIEQRWIMYSLFIGLTLGGAPLVWKLAKPVRAPFWIGSVAGVVAMSVLALAQQSGSSGGVASSNVFMLGLAGVAGASAMILPGVSGGYLLLVLGQYVPILASIDRAKTAVGDRDVGALMNEMGVFVPVGVGVVLGVVVVSNLVKTLLEKVPQATLGVLIGLLFGAVVGLWPFQHGVQPQSGDTFKGETLTAQTAALIEAEDWPVEYFTPKAWQAGAAGGLMLLGLGVTLALSRIGGKDEDEDNAAESAEPA